MKINENQRIINEILMSGRYALIGIGGADGSVVTPMFVNTTPAELVGVFTVLTEALRAETVAS